MAQNTEDLAAMLALVRTMEQRLAAQDEIIANLQRPSGASASTVPTIPVTQPTPDPPPPVDNPQVSDPQEIFPQAPTYRPLAQPHGEFLPFDSNDDPAMMKIARLEKALKKSQGFNSIPDIEDGYAEASVRLPEKFKMPHINRFDGSGDPIVHVRLFSDVLRPMGLSRVQKLSLFGRTLSDVAAIWYAKLEDSTKRNWEELSEGFVNQYSYNTQIEVTISELEATTQNPEESFINFVARWRAKAARMTNRPSEMEQVRLVVHNLEPDMLQRMIVTPLSTFASLHQLGVQIESAFKKGLLHRTSEPTRRPFTRNTNVGTSAMPRSADVSTLATSSAKMADPFAATTTFAAATNLQAAQNGQPLSQRTFTPLHMNLSRAFTMLLERGHLKPLDPRPLPDPLPPKHDPTQYCCYHQQHGHPTDWCYRLRHKIQDLIDNKIIAPPSKPTVTTNPLPTHNQVPPPRDINLIHRLPSAYNPNIYITPTHLPKPEVFIPKDMDLCMMDAPEPQSSQPPKLELPNSQIPIQPTPKNPAQPVHQDQIGSNTSQAPIAEPTTSQLLSMIEDLQSTVADLAFGILAPSPTTSCARNFRTKSSPILGQATIGKGQPEGILRLGDDMSTKSGPRSGTAIQSLGKAEARDKNETGASIDPYAPLRWVIEALKVKGLNKQQVLVVVTNIVADTFVNTSRSVLNQGVSHEKGYCTRNTPSSSNLTPADPSVNTSRTGNRAFNPLYMTLSKALQILMGQGHLKPLDFQPLPKRLPAWHDAAKYCAFHQQLGHDTDHCFRLRHEIQDLIDNKIITSPGSAKSIGTGSINLGDRTTGPVIGDKPPADGVHFTPNMVDGTH